MNVLSVLNFHNVTEEQSFADKRRPSVAADLRGYSCKYSIKDIKTDKMSKYNISKGNLHVIILLHHLSHSTNLRQSFCPITLPGQSSTQPQRVKHVV